MKRMDKEKPMNRARKLFFVFSLLALLLLTFTRPASAFDGAQHRFHE